MSKCKHELIFVEIIEGEQQAWIEDGKLVTNIGIGNQSEELVVCQKCNKRWVISKHHIVRKDIPDFIKNFYEKIQRLLEEKNQQANAYYE